MQLTRGGGGGGGGGVIIPVLQKCKAQLRRGHLLFNVLNILLEPLCKGRNKLFTSIIK